MKTFFKLFLLLLLAGSFAQRTTAQSRVTFPNGQQLFVNGMNLPWVNFAYDFGPGTTNLTEIGNRMKEIRDNGGNTMRFWIHCDGTNTPAFDANGTVTGAGTGTAEDLKAVCDSASKYNITLMLCLWSFDMLKSSQGSSTTRARNYALLTNDTKMNAYMNTALANMVTAVKGHKAILAWEIFNEPEAMTSDGQPWKDSGFEYYVSMSNIAKFVNLAADKIKSIDPSARVTNGSKSLMTNTDTQIADDWGFAEKNWYSDANLSAAGGKTAGKLDFYTVHYYDWMTAKFSPFDNNCSLWGLNKPLVVAEFYMTCVGSICGNSLHTTLYDKGYAGAMGWTDQNVNYRPQICSAMKNMQSLHAADVNITSGTNYGTNIAKGKPVSVSSTETSNVNIASYAVDGNTSTRWSSVYSDPQWIYVDLQSTYTLNRVVLTWEVASAKDYRIEVSNDATNWTSLVTKTAMTAGARVDDIALSGSGRYVRMYGTARTSSWGYSLYEFAVYGTAGNVAVTGVSLSPTSVSLTAKGQTQQLTATITPSNASNKTVSYTSSNSAVATVSSSGLVTAVANGTATITVTTQDGGKTATCAVTVNIPATTTVTYQAENASLTGTYVATSIAGYSGTGYVDGFDNTGDKVSFTVTAATAGTYTLVVRYASPYDNKPNYLYVNGTNLGEKTFTKSASFVEINLGNITLRAGANTVELVKSWGYFMVDYIKVSGASGLKSAQLTTEVSSLSNNSFNVFPNPSNGNFYLKLNNELNGANITVYDNAGKLIYKGIDINDGANISLSPSFKGMGFIRLEKDGQVVTQKIIVK